MPRDICVPSRLPENSHTSPYIGVRLRTTDLYSSFGDINCAECRRMFWNYSSQYFFTYEWTDSVLWALEIDFLGQTAMRWNSAPLPTRSWSVSVSNIFYCRLTPAYAFCILINVSIYKKFGNGPQWPMTIEKHVDQCETYWWTNLIYINNLYPISINDGVKTFSSITLLNWLQ